MASKPESDKKLNRSKCFRNYYVQLANAINNAQYETAQNLIRGKITITAGDQKATISWQDAERNLTFVQKASLRGHSNNSTPKQIARSESKSVVNLHDARNRIYKALELQPNSSQNKIKQALDDKRQQTDLIIESFNTAFFSAKKSMLNLGLFADTNPETLQKVLALRKTRAITYTIIRKGAHLEQEFFGFYQTYTNVKTKLQTLQDVRKKNAAQKNEIQQLRNELGELRCTMLSLYEAHSIATESYKLLTEKNYRTKNNYKNFAKKCRHFKISKQAKTIRQKNIGWIEKIKRIVSAFFNRYWSKDFHKKPKQNMHEQLQRIDTDTDTDTDTDPDSKTNSTTSSPSSSPIQQGLRITQTPDDKNMRTLQTLSDNTSCLFHLHRKDITNPTANITHQLMHAVDSTIHDQNIEISCAQSA